MMANAARVFHRSALAWLGMGSARSFFRLPRSRDCRSKIARLRRVALSRGVPVVELSAAADQMAGLFTLAGEQGGASSDEPVSASDTALLVPTSGTTAQSKIVPQSHACICTS